MQSEVNRNIGPEIFHYLPPIVRRYSRSHPQQVSLFEPVDFAAISEAVVPHYPAVVIRCSSQNDLLTDQNEAHIFVTKYLVQYLTFQPGAADEVLRRENLSIHIALLLIPESKPHTLNSRR